MFYINEFKKNDESFYEKYRWIIIAVVICLIKIDRQLTVLNNYLD